ncbi:MAG: hemolysin family protein [Cellulosilyticaceae bacterium]
MDSDPSSILSQLILIGGLTLVNAFFASAEMAIVSLNKNKIRALSASGNRNARLVEQLIEEPSRFLSTIQIGITLAGFFSSASAATGISQHVTNLLMPLNLPYTSQIAMISVTLLLSYFTLVFGELVPKRLALRSADHVALFTAPIVYMISILARPFIKVLSLSTTLVLRLMGISSDSAQDKVSEEELRTMIDQSQQDGCIATEEKDMIEGVFEFNDKNIKEIMTPRKETFMVDIETSNEEILEALFSRNYSRIPIYEDTTDHIIGVLYMKDLLKVAKSVGFDQINIREILHEPFFVQENKKTNELFKELKKHKTHMALLINEYGGFSGIVTMEDLLEEIVGDISDEYDVDQVDLKQTATNTYWVRGLVPVSRINHKLHIQIDQGEYDTLNGYLITQLGEIPKEQTKMELLTDFAAFRILKVSNTRIEEVEIQLT